MDSLIRVRTKCREERNRRMIECERRQPFLVEASRNNFSGLRRLHHRRCAYHSSAICKTSTSSGLPDISRRAAAQFTAWQFSTVSATYILCLHTARSSSHPAQPKRGDDMRLCRSGEDKLLEIDTDHTTHQLILTYAAGGCSGRASNDGATPSATGTPVCHT